MGPLGFLGRLARDAFVLEPSPEPAAASRLDPEPRFRPFEAVAPLRDAEAEPGSATRRAAS